MPERPTTEEIRAFLRYLNDTAVDVNDFWRSVQPETLQHVFRPVDIKDTFPRSLTLTPSDNTVTLDATVGPSQANRLLVIRSVYVEDIGAAAPQFFSVHRNAAAQRIWDDRAPAAGTVLLGGPLESPAWGARMPLVVYGDQDVTFRFARAPAGAMAFRLDLTGEEWESPFRNVGT